mgnify:CR=1 FL=1
METLIYIGKVSLYWVLFYACYQLFLRQQTFFVWNRIYLISALLVSFALPFVIYPEAAPEIPVMYEVNAAAFSITYEQPEEVSILTWTNAFILFYLLAVLRRFYEMYGNIRQLKGFIRDGELIELEDCKVVLINSNEVGSFSFLKWIVVNRNDYENHFDAILRHEMVHTSQGHSFDILFVEILRILFWFNPILILYKNALQEVHEYLADEAAPNREHYANFLVSYALNTPIAALTNHFFKPSQLKSRIQMIYKNRSSKWLRSSYILSFGIIGAIALLIAGCERIKKNFTDNTAGLPGQEMDSTKTIEVEGWITSSADKLAIPGVNVVVEGKELGTTTDKDGRFVINAPAYSSLSISFPGFSTQLRPLNGISGHVIALAPTGNLDQTAIEESAPTNAPDAKMPNAYRDTITETDPTLIPEIKIKTLELNETQEKVYTVVEKQPQFPGGNKAMYKFLGDNIIYPSAATRASVSGRVFLSFTVTEKGLIQDIQVLKGIGFGCDAEAVRVVKSFPKWNPGMQDGKAVSVKYNLPIHFQIEDDKRQGHLYPIESEDQKGKSYGLATTIENAVGANRENDLTSARTVSASALNSDGALFRQPGLNIRNENAGISLAKMPLVVLDGNELKNSESKEILSKIAPNRIESVSVLKDHSATSIYGTKGVNGVLLITTKKPSLSDFKN